MFCANSFEKRGHFPRCEGAWCGRCYHLRGDDTFPRKSGEYEGWVKDEDETDRFQFGRAGDHLCTRFQCDECHFINLKKRIPSAGSGEDMLLLKYIRRANLDSLWSLEPATVASNRGEFARAKMCLDFVGLDLETSLPSMGPARCRDEQGMAMAVALLVRSLDPGHNETTVQFDTTRKMRSMFGSMWHASKEASSSSVAVQGQTKLTQSDSPTNGEWFSKFMKGFHKRVGDKSNPDRAISIEVMLELHRRLKIELSEALEAKDAEGIRDAIMLGAFTTFGYCGGLRGEEIMIADLGGMNQHWKEARSHSTPHVPLALRGRFKGETGEQWHYMPLADRTASGLDILYWASALRDYYGCQGVVTGPAFRDALGRRVKASHFSKLLIGHLESIQVDRPDLIPPSVKVSEEYGTSRSLRRGSTSQAMNQDVPEADVERNNRWRGTERSKGRKVARRMLNHYADVRLIIKRLLKYSAML